MISYTPSFIPNVIAIYGVGGTGSRLVPLIAQFIKTCPWVISPEVYLFDPDVVEEKNLTRQNFVKTDVGKKKADVLAQRYSRAFDCNIIPIGEKAGGPDINKSPQYYDAIRRIQGSKTINILCVDSPEARRGILKEILGDYPRSSSESLILDSGNENDYGQVTISTNCFIYPPVKPIDQLKKLLPEFYPVDLKIDGIPIDVKYFEEMVAVSSGSCADLDQTMAINCLMATTLFGILQNFFYAKPISYHRINVSLQHGTTLEYMTLDYLLNRNEEYRNSTLLSGSRGLIKTSVYSLEQGIYDLVIGFGEVPVTW